MSNNLTRRDFLNGVSLGVAGAALIGSQSVLSKAVREASSSEFLSGGYPPVLTGIRGSHDGSFDTAHALAWRGETPSEYRDLDDEYDLVVVGAGISGLAAAILYQQKAGLDSRILILDNHDDFGGHARRNEFHYQGRMYLGAGGSGNFQDSRQYSTVSKKLVADLGFNMDELRKTQDMEWPLSNPATKMGMYTDKAHFGEDAIVSGMWLAAWHGVGNYEEMINSLAISSSEKAKLVAFIEGTLTLAEPFPDGDARDFLKHTSYKTLLTDYVGLQDLTCTLLDPFMNVTYGVGVEGLSIYEGLKTGLPGASILSDEMLAVLADAEMLQESDIVWMPDGNASLTRQMVRYLIPAVAPGRTVDDLVSAHFDYEKLDRAEHPVQLRLNSTVVNAVNSDDNSVLVSYVRAGEEAARVRTKHCIMACNNGIIPHLCPDLPEAQKENLKYGVRQPLLAVNVLVKSGKPVLDSGSRLFLCPTSHFKMVSTAPPVTIGDYVHNDDPDEPMVVYLLTTPTEATDGNQSARDRFRVARHQLYTTTFEDYETQIHEQLNGMFKRNGFDAARDIVAITVNRWSHGYAYMYKSLYDPEWPEGETPHELGRKPFGRISIANSDAEAVAYLNAAIDAAARAVNEQLQL
ncbi:MAG: NAD(P)-binding protein [Pseudomonadota bacterium]